MKIEKHIKKFTILNDLFYFIIELLFESGAFIESKNKFISFFGQVGGHKNFEKLLISISLKIIKLKKIKFRRKNVFCKNYCIINTF